ncbi:MAG: hypothetical protein K0R73_713 [Candidatus Midichloriaceae bacterium]|jgi:hypothetical protein|nr:hypothetical protein [Candidatus Midichloriaceae bacterium]
MHYKLDKKYHEDTKTLEIGQQFKKFGYTKFLRVHEEEHLTSALRYLGEIPKRTSAIFLSLDCRSRTKLSEDHLRKVDQLFNKLKELNIPLELDIQSNYDLLRWDHRLSIEIYKRIKDLPCLKKLITIGSRYGTLILKHLVITNLFLAFFAPTCLTSPKIIL